MPATRHPRALPIDSIYLNSAHLRLPAPMTPTWAWCYLLAQTVTGVTGAVLLARWTDAGLWLSVAVGLTLSVLTALTGRHLATAWWGSRPPLEHPVSWLCQRTFIRFDLEFGWLASETCDGPADLRIQVTCSYCTQIETANWCQDCIDTANQRPKPRSTACGRPIAEVRPAAGTR